MDFPSVTSFQHAIAVRRKDSGDSNVGGTSLDFHIVTQLVYVFLEFGARRGESLGYRQRQIDTVLLVNRELAAGHV